MAERAVSKFNVHHPIGTIDRRNEGAEGRRAFGTLRQRRKNGRIGRSNPQRRDLRGWGLGGTVSVRVREARVRRTNSRGGVLRSDERTRIERKQYCHPHPTVSKH